MAYSDYGAFVYLNGERRTDKEDVGVYDTDEGSLPTGLRVYANIMKRIKFARPVDCPTCGATPSHQKWKPRKLVYTNEMVAIGDVDPVDAVHCPRCDLVFGVVHYEHDDTYITSWTEFETVPRYCPWCGEDLTDD